MPPKKIPIKKEKKKTSNPSEQLGQGNSNHQTNIDFGLISPIVGIWNIIVTA